MDGIKFKRFRRNRKQTLGADYVQPAYDALNAIIARDAAAHVTTQDQKRAVIQNYMSKQSEKLELAKHKAILEAAHAALIDEAGALEKELNPFKAKLRRLDELRKTIRGWYDDADPSKVFSAYGDTYRATVGECGNETIILDMDSIFEAAGKARFLAVCKVSLTTLKEIVDPALVTVSTAQRQSGPRSLSILPIRAEVA